jgi:hypothetical protein
MSQAVTAAKELDPKQKTQLGTAGMIAGIILIAMLSFAELGAVLEVVLGIIGVIILVVGVILIGTSQGSV